MAQALSTRQKADTVRDLLDKFKPQLKLALPRHISPDRMARVALTTCAKNPALLNCTPASLIGAVLTASQLGLEVDDTRGLAYLVPYKDKCTLIPGYKGMIELARRGGAAVTAHAVHELDEFDYQYGTEQYLHHKPSKEDDRGPVVFFYAIAHMREGLPVFEVWSAARVRAHREQYSPRKGGTGIQIDDETYGRKTLVRRLAPYIPQCPELQMVAHLDELAERGEDQGLEAQFVVDTPENEKPASDKKLEAISGGKTADGPKKAGKKDEPKQLSETQIIEIHEVLEASTVHKDDFDHWVKTNYTVDDWQQLPETAFDVVMDWIESQTV